MVSGQGPFSDASIQSVYSPREVEFRAYKPADGKAEDEEYGIFALAHVGQRSVHAEHKAAQAKSLEEHFLVFLPDSRPQQRAESTAGQDGCRVDDSP